MENINDCLIINLEERTDLWENLQIFRDKWEKSNKKWYRISGVNYRSQSNVLNEFIINNRINLNGNGFRETKSAFLGELGCFMGHFNSWKYIVENKLDTCLILEDGIEFLRDDFDKLRIQKNTDILFVNEEMKMAGPKNFVGYGLQGYVVTYKGAEFLLKKCYTLVVPIDLQIRHLCNTSDINATVLSESFVKRNNNRLSSIGLDIDDLNDLNKKQNQNPIIQRILTKLIERNINLDDFI